MTSPPQRVLITYGRARMTHVVARSLARAGFAIYVCDAAVINMTRASRVIRGFDRTPSPFRAPAAYVACLAEIIRRRKIDVLVPGHDDVFAIQAHADWLPAGVMVAAPPYADLVAAADKLNIVRVAERAGVRVPKTIAIDDLAALPDAAAELGYPLIIKTRRGSGARGVQLVHAPHELAAQYRRLLPKTQERPAREISAHCPALQEYPVLQEYIAGGELWGACFLAHAGEVHACFTERYVRCKRDQFGTSVLRLRCEWPLLAEAAAKIARALHWTGIGQLDFITNAARTSAAQPEAYLLEMNPRWWGALNLAVVNGFDFPRGYLTMLLEGNPAADAFCPTPRPIASLWIAGEAQACWGELRQGNLLAPMTSLWRIIAPGPDCVYDDFEWRDPLPLAAELAQYIARLLRARGRELEDADVGMHLGMR